MRVQQIVAVLLVGPWLWSVGAQQPPAAGAPRPTARARAPVDLTGYWVSVVTEDWRWRMLVPPKGDYTSVPLNPTGRQAADQWDPAKASADGCKAYGAAAIMRVPARLHITWETDDVLRIEIDAGRQVRRLQFAPSNLRSTTPTWQGVSRAEWQPAGGRAGGQGVVPRSGATQAAPPRGGSLKATTTGMRAGYLRANGVPYSANALVTDHFDRHQTFGTEWLTVTTIVDDPQYLLQPFITSSDFKREADGSRFAPVACE
jgi:hypothetical protein